MKIYDNDEGYGLKDEEIAALYTMILLLAGSIYIIWEVVISTAIWFVS